MKYPTINSLTIEDGNGKEVRITHPYNRIKINTDIYCLILIVGIFYLSFFVDNGLWKTFLIVISMWEVMYMDSIDDKIEGYKQALSDMLENFEE